MEWGHVQSLHSHVCTEYAECDLRFSKILFLTPTCAAVCTCMSIIIVRNLGRGMALSQVLCCIVLCYLSFLISCV